MYYATTLNTTAAAARRRQTLGRKCIAQTFFTENFPAMEAAAARGDTSICLTLPRSCATAEKEIRMLFHRFGYRYEVKATTMLYRTILISWE